MTLTYGEKAEAKLAGTILRVLRSGRAKYALSAGATAAVLQRYGRYGFRCTRLR